MEKKPKFEERPEAIASPAAPAVVKPVLSSTPLIKQEHIKTEQKSDEITEEVTFFPSFL